MEEKVQLFETQQVRTAWDEQSEKWWFSVLDIITILADQADYKKVRNYWKWLKNKLNSEGSEVVSITNQLKLKALLSPSIGDESNLSSSLSEAQHGLETR